MLNASDAKIEEHFDKAADFIYQALSRDKGKCFVHCFMGESRAAALILAYSIKYERYKLDDAVRMMCLKRHISLNEGFMSKLMLYQKHVNKK